MSDEHEELLALREALRRLLAAALQSDLNHTAEIDRVQDQYGELTVALTRSELEHAAEMGELREHHAQELKDFETQSDLDHAAAIADLEHLHADVVANLNCALETRTVIGQATGVLMATFGCSADAAFSLLVRQSQHENRKLSEVSVAVVSHVERTADQRSV